jgi:protocatechuate 3,4-dioxygenase beta subunit
MLATLRFRSPDGAPIRDLLVYAYHANAAGHYVPAPGATGCFRFHGRLHGWARPDSVGQVILRSIRPGGYPRSTEPAHVHVVVQFPGARGFYVNDVLFDDDVRLTAKIRAQQLAPGGTGVVRAKRDAKGVWVVSRDIVLQRPTR